MEIDASFLIADCPGADDFRPALFERRKRGEPSGSNPNGASALAPGWE